MVDQSRARWLRYFIGLASLSKSPCSLACSGALKNTFWHHVKRFYWYPSTKREQDFLSGQHHIVPFFACCQHSTGFFGIPNTGLPHYIQTLCIVALPFRLGSPSKCFSWKHLIVRSSSICTRGTKLQLLQPTTYFPAFHLACWQSFLSLQNHFLCSGSAFSRRKQKPFGKKIFWKVPLYLTASIPDPSAFPCERTAILLLFDILGQACFVTFTGLCFSGASPHLLVLFPQASWFRNIRNHSARLLLYKPTEITANGRCVFLFYQRTRANWTGSSKFTGHTSFCMIYLWDQTLSVFVRLLFVPTHLFSWYQFTNSDLPIPFHRCDPTTVSGFASFRRKRGFWGNLTSFPFLFCFPLSSFVYIIAPARGKVYWQSA